MRINKSLARLRAGEPVKLGFLGHFIPPYVAVAAANGYDAIWLDLEHRPMDAREVQAILAFCHLYDIDCIIRTPTREKSQLYRYLEDGAAGLMIPLIETAEEAQEIVKKVKFPPLGDRGLEGRGLDANFGIDTPNDDARERFVQHANRETLLIVQLESPAASRQAEAIAAVEGVDMLFAGPSDFDIRARQLPPKERMTFDESLAIIAAACERYGKWWGVMPRHLEHVRDYTARGAKFIPWGIDVVLLTNGLKQHAQDLNEIFGRD